MQPLAETIRERIGGVEKIDFSFREVHYHCLYGDLIVTHLPDGFLYHTDKVIFRDLTLLVTDEELAPGWGGPPILSVESNPSIQEKRDSPPTIPVPLLNRWLIEVEYDLFPLYTRPYFSLHKYEGITSRLMEVADYQSRGKSYRTYRDLLSDRLWDLPPKCRSPIF